MKLRDFVVNSLPRVRGKKKTRGVNPSSDASSKGRHDAPSRQPTQLPSVSRESSVERASHVAVADARWRPSPPREPQDEVALVGAMAYYTPPPGMVMSRSAEGISAHSLAVMTSQCPAPDYSGPYSHMAAISETAVNYSMPKNFVFQSQHHHRHNHQHNYHYVYHHHHHHQYSPDPSSRTPLTENNQNHHHHQNRCKTNTTSRKSEPGFLRKSFASFKALRKQRSSGKEAIVVSKSKATDENGKCSVCPYPQLHAVATEVKKPADIRPAKPKRRGLKSLRKSKQNPEEQMDKTWFSDNDASNGPDHHMSDADLFYHRSRPRFRECSVESCMSRLYGSQDGSNGPESDYRAMDSNSLSGYESDLPKTKAGRTRSRIKTNPWLPSPQPSLNIGRRIAQCDFRESHEDVMTVDDDFISMPRSASFEHQRPTVLSSFQSSSKNRSIQRHRSLTPSDLKIALNVNKNSSETQSLSPQSLQRTKHCGSDNDTLNDLSSTVVKLRPDSILAQESEFVILTDNIEQLANNISFEYEDMLDTTLESVSTCQEDGKISIQELLTDEELNGVGKNKEVSFSNSNHSAAKAHSPDSGIGCLGSSDGDELTMAGATSNEQSSLSSSGTCVTPPENYLNIASREETKISHVSDMIDISSDAENSNNWSEPQIDLHGQNVHCHFATHLNTSINSLSPSSSSALRSLSDATRSSKLVNVTDAPICESNYFEKTDVNRRMTEKEEILETNLSLSQKEETLQESLHDIRESLLCRPTLDTFSNSLADTANEVIVQSPSLHDDRLFSDNFNNLHKNGINSEFSDSIIQIENKKTIQLPPNIMRSEFTTPVDSPTENWQCDADFFLQFHSGSVRAEQNSSQREDIFIGGRDTKHSDSIPTYRQNISSTDSIQANEKLGVLTAENMSEGAADRNENMTDSNNIDWVDASVQTDFYEEDFDSWQDSNSHALGDLCDEEFDPIESTRRWLLTGNMQGSADTGYSSQPRDSQILMDDDESIASDNHNENKIAPPTFQSSGNDITATTMLSDSAAMKINPDIPTNEKEEINNAYQASEFKCSEGEKRTQSEKLVHNMFSGIESQFKDIFSQLWPAQVVPEISGNKRDSSGSSTSTLISESVGGASTSDFTPREQNGFDEVTPRNSGCGNIEIKKVEEVKKHQNPLQKNASKKKKTASSVEPDYVNIPRRGRANKTNGWHAFGMPEVGNKEFSVSFKKCAVQSYPYSEESVNLCRPGSNSKSCLKNRTNIGSTERADYLEFLRDAPLENAHHKRPMFLIPGFGPIDMSSAALSRLASDEWIATTEADHQGSANSKTYAHLSGLDSNKTSQARIQISESRSVARPKLIHDKESRDLKIGSHSDKRYHMDQDMSKFSRNVLPEKPKRKNPRAIQAKPCPTRTQRTYSPLSGQLDLEDVRHAGNSTHVTKTSSHHTRTYPDNSTRGIIERVWQLQREKDLIYSQLREVQQEELSRQRQQLQHHRNVHSQRKDILLETLRELKENLEEQSRQLNIKCNKDVYI